MREKVQSEALQALINNRGGTVVLSVGTGKCKVAIDYIKHIQPKNVLITSPRINLKENWERELNKWGIIKSPLEWWYNHIYSLTINIINIQTCYKWSKEQLQQFDLIIVDEIHTSITPEYGKLIINAKELAITTIGLTGTPDDRKFEKELFYKSYCPIVYKFLQSEEKKIVNKKKYIIFEYELTDSFKTVGGTKKNPFLVGEKTQYNYIESQIIKGKKMIDELLPDFKNIDYFYIAKKWLWDNEGNTNQKSAASKYLNGVRTRKSFLNNLSSSATIAKAIKSIILEIPNSKILLFSELTSQSNKLSNFTVHSNNKEEHNKEMLRMFNNNEIRELSSCHSLTLGLNLTKPNFAIVESYNSSGVQLTQKLGRTNRLRVDDIAIITIIKVKNTQVEKWFEKSTDVIIKNSTTVNNLTEFKKELIKLYE